MYEATKLRKRIETLEAAAKSNAESLERVRAVTAALSAYGQTVDAAARVVLSVNGHL